MDFMSVRVLRDWALDRPTWRYRPYDQQPAKPFNREDCLRLLRHNPHGRDLLEGTRLVDTPGFDKYRYRHESLDLTTPCIRLVSIQRKRSQFGFLRCSIRTVSFSEAIRYQCLSYRWGTPQRSEMRTILLSHNAPGPERVQNFRPLDIGPNLHSFLELVWRNRQTEGMEGSCQEDLGHEFWIDALYIDQNNDDEKGHQVRQMAQVYSFASRVVIWLGDTGTIALLSQQESRKDLLFQLCEDQYWKRAWIVQELVLAREAWIVMKDGLLSLKHFLHHVHERSEPAKFRKYIGDRREEGARPELLHMLEAFQNQQATEPRDRVFSLLGLVREADKVAVDYRARNMDLLFPISQACGAQHCFCSVSIIANALELLTVDDPFYPTNDGPYIKVSLDSSDHSRTDCAAFEMVRERLLAFRSRNDMLDAGVVILEPRERNFWWIGINTFIIILWSPVLAGLPSNLCSGMRSGRPLLPVEVGFEFANEPTIRSSDRTPIHAAWFQVYMYQTAKVWPRLLREIDLLERVDDVNLRKHSRRSRKARLRNWRALRVEQTESTEGDTTSSAMLAEFLAIAPTVQDTETELDSTMLQAEDGSAQLAVKTWPTGCSCQIPLRTRDRTSVAASHSVEFGSLTARRTHTR
jgi:hypothetical protein